LKGITFITKAEDKCLSVACSSLISRYIFVKEIDKLGDKYGIFLPKGANYYVEDVGIKLVEKYGVNVLKEVAKLNFSNTDRILKEVRK
jgi:ribonuclease HIII